MNTLDAVDITHYTYRVSWSAEDGEYVATCAEFPSLSWLAPVQTDALTGLEDVVAGVVDDMRQSGEPAPEPLAERQYSGTFNVRINPDLHRELVIEASERGMSLNRFISDRLRRSK